MTEILIIQMMVWVGHHGLPIHQVKKIDGHGYLNRTVCLELARRIRHRWSDKAEIIYVNCPDWWAET